MGEAEIRHRVQRAHLMKVDLLHGYAVGLGLSLGDAAVNSAGSCTDLQGKCQRIYDGGDVRHRGVVVTVRMAVFVAVMGLVMRHLMDGGVDGVLMMT